VSCAYWNGTPAIWAAKWSHPRGAHDDRANSLFGVLRVLSNYRGFSIERMLANERTEEQQQHQTYAQRNFQQYLWRVMGVNPRQPNRPWARQPWD
jgi:hypothetical protein